MHPAISYELATTRIADLRRQAQREALAAAAPVPSIARRFGQQLWTLLRARRSCSTARPPLQAVRD